MNRVQLALNVKNLDESISFYSQLFQTSPHKTKPGYANFALTNPPLKLVLFENPEAAETLNHLGVELTDVDEVARHAARLADTTLETKVSHTENCCHAVQDKVYIAAPDLPTNQWEFYTIVDDNPKDDQINSSAATAQKSSDVCCSG